MNTIQRNEGRENRIQKGTLSQAFNLCKAALTRINNARETILAEAKSTLEAPEQLLRLAVREAEALAYQTRYPQLVFADLATEKMERAAAWSERQLQLD
jgi:hypothetical protein